MGLAENFYLDNYTTQKLFKSGTEGSTELVCGSDGLPYVRKIINYEVPALLDLAKISHAVLPKIYFASCLNGKTYVIEEYLAGDTLKELLADGHVFSEQEIIDLSLQLCDVLIVLHKQHIIHRDIKPSNILLLNNSAHIKLIDFGTARKFEADQEDNSDTNILGTPGYAPPEQFGFAATDARSDIYAFGVTFKDLLPASYHGKLIKVLNKCTELDPKNRIATAEELKRQLLAKPLPFNVRILALGGLFCVLLAGHLWLSKYPLNRHPAAPAPTPSTAPSDTSTPSDKPVMNNTSPKSGKVIPDGNSKLELPTPSVPDAQPDVSEKQKDQSKRSDATRPLLPLAKDVTSEEYFHKTINTITREEREKEISPNWDMYLTSTGWTFTKPEKEYRDQEYAPVTADGAPQITVYNNSDEPWVNPRVDVNFTVFGVQFSEKQRIVKISVPGGTEVLGGGMWTSTWIGRIIGMQFNGTIPPHGSHTFTVLQHAQGFAVGCFANGIAPRAMICIHGRDKRGIPIVSYYTIGIHH